MKVQIPKSNFRLTYLIEVVAYFFVALTVYSLWENIWAGIAVFLSLVIAVPQIKRYRINRTYKRHLKNFGVKFNDKYTESMFELTVMGFFPYLGNVMHCEVYVDGNGIIVSKSRTRRLLPWSIIVGQQVKEYLGHEIIELNVNNFEKSNRLLIPWCDEFDKHIPPALS